MRIALIQEERYLPTYHGSNKGSRRLLECLARDGHACLALSPVRRAGTSLEELRRDLAARGVRLEEHAPGRHRYTHEGVEVRGLPGDTACRPAFIVEQLRRFAPDVVLVSADPRRYFLAAALEAAPARVVFVVQSHEHLPFGPLSLAPDATQAALLRQARAILVYSRYSRDYVLSHGGLAARRMPFPVYGDGPFADCSRVPGDRVTQISVDETKGGRVFLELARAFPAQEFAAIRWGADAGLLAELGRCPNVRLLDPVDDVLELLRRTRVLLMPSLLPETFGFAAVEAMLHGVPVLASDLGALPEATGGAATLLPVAPVVVRSGRCHVPAQELAPWRSALGALLRDPELHARAARAARAAAGRFVSTVSTRPFEALFREIAPPGPRPTVAVVDPFDAAFLLAEELAVHGHRVVGVESSAHLAPQILAACDRERLTAMVPHRGDLDATLRELRRLRAGVVLPGCEPGVPLADALAEAMGTPGNGTALSMARRDKSLMAEHARAAGLRVPRQHGSGEWPEIAAWARRLGRWPVIAKPPHSLASEDVHVCRDERELQQAFQRILARRNISGLVNHAVLAQELLDGTQYVVDTLSRGGEHFLSAVWRYGRPAFARPLLRWARGAGAWPEPVAHLTWDQIRYAAVGNDSKLILPGDDELARTLFGYARRLLDALGIREGPAHFELMWVEGEPLLVEVGARLHGAPNTHWMCAIATGASQVDGLIDLRLAPERFARHARETYRLRWHGANVRLHPWRAGRFAGFRGLERIERLPSFSRFWYLAQPRQVDVLDCLGVVALIHADAEVVQRDFAAVRECERAGLFDLVAEPAVVPAAAP